MLARRLVLPKTAFVRFISSKAVVQTDTNKVNVRGTFIPSFRPDMPTLIWFPDVLEPAENFKAFFEKSEAIREIRNVWLINPRNFGDSDHHSSFNLHEMGEDVVRFMNDNNIHLATIGGHGFGAKLAAVTAIDNLDRFTGLINLEGGPLDHTYHEAYVELKEWV